MKSSEEGFLVKEKKVRKDRRHNQKHLFDDESELHKKAGKRGHSKMRPVDEYEVEVYEDDPYAEDIQYMMRYIK